MAIKDGDNLVSGDIISFQEANRLKNNWRGAAEPTNIQPGMIFSDEDDDTLHHAGAGTGTPTDEVLQETRSHECEPVFKHLFLDLDSASVADPPTDAQLKSKFGTPPLAGFIAFLKNTSSGSSKVYIIFADGTNYFYHELTKAT